MSGSSHLDEESPFRDDEMSVSEGSFAEELVMPNMRRVSSLGMDESNMAAAAAIVANATAGRGVPVGSPVISAVDRRSSNHSADGKLNSSMLEIADLDGFHDNSESVQHVFHQNPYSAFAADARALGKDGKNAKKDLPGRAYRDQKVQWQVDQTINLKNPNHMKDGAPPIPSSSSSHSGMDSSHKKTFIDHLMGGVTAFRPVNKNTVSFGASSLWEVSTHSRSIFSDRSSRNFFQDRSYNDNMSLRRSHLEEIMLSESYRSNANKRQYSGEIPNLKLPSDPNSFSNRSKKMIIAFLFFMIKTALFLALLAATLFLLFSFIMFIVHKRQDMLAAAAAVPAPTVAPTSLATELAIPHVKIVPLDKEIRIEVIRQMILDNGISEAPDLSNVRSIPFYAMRWLSDADDPPLPLDHPQLLQRYALVVFCYSQYPSMAERHSNGEYWAANMLKTDSDYFHNWMMSSSSVCEWSGVECRNDNIIGLSLKNGKIGGSIPRELVALSHLETLDLSNNRLDGPIPRALTTGLSNSQGLSKLETLHLDHNLLSGRIPSLEALTTLTTLKLDHNALSGPVPAIDFSTRLKKLHLNDNSLHGRLPALRTATSLEELQLGHNMFSGAIPLDIGYLTNLVDFRVEGNNLEGQLPYLNNLSNLKILSVGSNSLTGTIPKSWGGNLYSLATLSMNHNNLIGTIPTSIGKLLHLKALWIGDNGLTGTIPTQFGNLRSIETLLMDNNKLTGEVPVELSNMGSIRSIHAYSNDITGVMPDEVCSLVTIIKTLLDLQMDCKSNMTCSCCTQCF